mgnify:CR=1 FL=1|tara:strand:+ start:189 stop:443 length:255 start_codon:yes stop_codon:yes gene_type:complete
MKLTKSKLKQLIKEQLETELDVEVEEETTTGGYSDSQLNMLLEDLPSWLKEHGIVTHSMQERLELLEDLYDQLESNQGDAQQDF